ncbi:MAG: YibE/F family protein [Mycoplasmatota bacterium]
MNRYKEILIISVVSFFIIFLSSHFFDYASFNNTEIAETAKVIEITSVEESDYGSTIVFDAKLTSGDMKNEIVSVTQQIDSYYGYNSKEVIEDDKIIITSYDNETFAYVCHNRIGTIVFLLFIFIALIFAIAKFKGIPTLLSLVITICTIFFVYIAGILNGFNVYLLTILVITFIILTNLTLLNGFNKKTLGAIVGNILGITIAGIVAIIFNHLFRLTGILDQDYIYLTLLEGVSIDLVGIIWGGLLIAALGAIMDVSMSLSSSLYELSKEKDATFKKLVTSGMTIGRDIIGTMINTLILAYVGSSLAIILLFTAYSKNILIIFNLEMIIVEITQSVVGSIGILLSVPATVIFCAYLYTKKDV